MSNITVKRVNMLKDALYNVRRSSGASDEYARGLVVGVVSALLAMTDVSFETAMAVVVENLPASFDLGRLPASFQSYI